MFPPNALLHGAFVKTNFLTFYTQPEVNVCIPTWFAILVIWTKKTSVSNVAGNIPDSFRSVVMSVWDTCYYIGFPKNSSIITIKNSMLSGKVNVNITTAPVLLACLVNLSADCL